MWKAGQYREGVDLYRWLVWEVQLCVCVCVFVHIIYVLASLCISEEQQKPTHDDNTGHKLLITEMAGQLSMDVWWVLNIFNDESTK